jgi:hypothetical protein
MCGSRDVIIHYLCCLRVLSSMCFFLFLNLSQMCLFAPPSIRMSTSFSTPSRFLSLCSTAYSRAFHGTTNLGFRRRRSFSASAKKVARSLEAVWNLCLRKNVIRTNRKTRGGRASNGHGLPSWPGSEFSTIASSDCQVA